MKSFPVAASAFSFAIVLFVTPAAPQSTARHQISGARETTIQIEKVNKRPEFTAVKLIKDYERLLRSRPNDAIILNNLGVNYYLAGRVFESQSFLRRASQRSPESTQIRVNLAIVLNKTFNPDLAIETLEGVLKQEPQLTRAREVLCDIYSQEEKYTEAIACFGVLEKAGELSASDAASYGTALIEKKEIDRALSVLTEADLEFPDNAAIKNGLGIILYLKKRYKSAEMHLDRAVELEPTSPRIRYNLAVAQMSVNKRGAVLEQYKFLKTSDPELASQLYKLLFRDKIVSVKPQ